MVHDGAPRWSEKNREARLTSVPMSGIVLHMATDTIPTAAAAGERKRTGAMIALVAMQGTFKDVKGEIRTYGDGALIYPSVRSEGTESATRHAARLLTQRRVAKLDGHGEPITVDGEVQYEDLSAVVLTFEDGFAAHRYYGVDEMADFLKGRTFTASGKLPSGVNLAWTRAKKAATADARKAAKAAAKAEAKADDAKVEDQVEA